MAKSTITLIYFRVRRRSSNGVIVHASLRGRIRRERLRASASESSGFPDLLLSKVAYSTFTTQVCSTYSNPRLNVSLKGTTQTVCGCNRCSPIISHNIDAAPQ